MEKTIGGIDFINLTPFNPMISKCEIKVFYVGENRNGSYISKETALEMANTLPGSPILGYYKEEKEDFADHGEVITIDDQGIKFEKKTKPYGFVDMSAEAWFQDFEEEDDFGNVVVRSYLMTNGFLWTGRYDEVRSVLTQGRPQSMELEEKSLEGHWAKNSKSGLEFFIIDRAVISGLCILGEDIEPCFEGASVTEPKVNFDYAAYAVLSQINDMMVELNFALKGGQPKMENPKEMIEKSEYDLVTQNFEETKAQLADVASELEQLKIDYAKTSEDFASLQAQSETQKSEFTTLTEEVEELRQYKKGVETEKKQELIATFTMLTEEDKLPVIEKIDEYSLTDIKEKLSVICFDKKLYEAPAPQQTETPAPSATFNLHTQEIEKTEEKPGFLSVLDSVL